MGSSCSCEKKMSHVPRTLTLCQILSVTAFLLGAGSIFGLPAVLILLCSCCARVDFGWFVAASISSLLAAAQAAVTAYYLLHWHLFWNDIIEPIRRNMGQSLDAATEARIYETYAEYEFVAYIAMGVAALWLLCSMLLCYFSGSYKQFLRVQGASAHDNKNDSYTSDDDLYGGKAPISISQYGTSDQEEAPMFASDFNSLPSTFR